MMGRKYVDIDFFLKPLFQIWESNQFLVLSATALLCSLISKTNTDSYIVIPYIECCVSAIIGKTGFRR